MGERTLITIGSTVVTAWTVVNAAAATAATLQPKATILRKMDSNNGK